MKSLAALVLLAAPVAAQSFPPVIHYVVPQGYERALGTASEMFPLDYSNYVRYQLAIDKAALPGPGPLLGMAFRARNWPLMAGAYWVDLRVLAGHTKLNVHQLGALYDNNFSDVPVEVFRGRLNVAVPPAAAELGPFDAALPFTKLFIFLGVDHLLLDLAPLQHSVFGVCNGGGAGRGYDALSTHPQIGHCLGKNKLGCGIPLDGGSPAPGGLITELWLAGGTSYPGGCVTANPVPEAAFNGVPFAGALVGFELNRAPAGAAAVLMVGYNDQAWGGLPLPLDLTGFGLTGCKLCLQPLVLLGAVLTGTQPDRAWAFQAAQVPNNPALFGAPVVSQWLLAVSGANPAGLLVTDGVRVSVR